jgi:hypothetical protein
VSGGTATSTPLLARPTLGELGVEHLLDMSVDLEPAQPITTAIGARMTFVARGGRVSGPRVEGELLPGGGDWLLVGDDRIGRIDARATIRTDDGALIHFEARGVIDVPPDGLERLAEGDRLPFEETYVRTTPVFETADERYSWLSGVVAVGHNELAPDHVDYRIYRVL